MKRVIGTIARYSNYPIMLSAGVLFALHTSPPTPQVMAIIGAAAVVCVACISSYFVAIWKWPEYLTEE